MITISGPPFSGKTTLWRDLKGTFGDQIEFIEDLPRRALEALDPILSAWSAPEFQDYVGFAQLLAEQSAPAGRKLVSDKSLIDALAYSRVLFSEPSPPWAAALTPGRYRLALVCDYRDIDTAPDRLQQVHFDRREQIEHEVLALAGSYASRVVRLSGSPAMRLGAARREIEGLPASSGPPAR